MAIVEKIMSAEEFQLMPDDGISSELVKGVVVAMNVPAYPHGRLCIRLGYLLESFLESHPIGRGTSNDSGIVTTRNPDSVRGPDVAYISYDRIPKGTRIEGYPGVAADVVFEVRSPSDRWSELLEKSAEYIRAGVSAVCIIDIPTRSAHLYRDQANAEVFRSGEVLRIAEIHPDFEVNMDRLFESID